MSATGRHPIGFAGDKFIGIAEGRFYNLDATFRTATCPTCAAAVGAQCVVSRGPNKGRLSSYVHARRGRDEFYAEAPYKAHDWQRFGSIKSTTDVRQELRQKGVRGSAAREAVVQRDLEALAANASQQPTHQGALCASTTTGGAA